MTSPRIPDHAIAIECKVGLHHCDPLGIAWHGRYFEWLEAARTELFCSVDLDVPKIRDLGFLMYIVDARCRYLAPLRYGDSVRVTAWFSSSAPLLRVAYQLYNPSAGRRIARASTALATLTLDGTLQPTTPDALLSRLPAR